MADSWINNNGTWVKPSKTWVNDNGTWKNPAKTWVNDNGTWKSFLESSNLPLPFIACGGYHTFLIKQNGSVWATGGNYYGQLGLGDTNNRTSFTQLSTAFNNPQIISCIYEHTFIEKSDGTVWCTGSDALGQLGLGYPYSWYTDDQGCMCIDAYQISFVQLPTSFNNSKIIIGGVWYTVVVKADGTIWGAGYNSDGQFGIGSNYAHYVFTQLPTSFNNPKMITCKRGWSIFIVKQDGTVWSSGCNDYGQLGLGDTINRYSFTQLSTEFNNPKMVVCGQLITFIVKSDGTVWSVGYNGYGQLGLGDTNDRTSFTQLSTSFNNPKMLITSGKSTFLAKQDGTVWAVGDNSYGQLGLGDNTNRTSFTQLSTSFNNPKMISCGDNHTFLVKSDGTVWATGNNTNGQLGLGDTANRSFFTQVAV